jgi:hypothetical protein
MSNLWNMGKYQVQVSNLNSKLNINISSTWVYAYAQSLQSFEIIIISGICGENMLGDCSIELRKFASEIKNFIVLLR